MIQVIDNTYSSLASRDNSVGPRSGTRRRKEQLLVAIIGALMLAALAARAQTYHVGIQPDGSVVLPTDQVIHPLGQQVQIDGRPAAMALSPDGRTAAVLKTSGRWFSKGKEPIVIIDLTTGSVKQRFAPYDSAAASFAGLAYSSDGSKLYASDSGGAVMVANVASDGTLSAAAKISLPVADPSRGVSLIRPQGSNTANPAGLALSADGKCLYVLLNMNNSLGVIDLASNTVTGQIPVGNAPNAIVVDGPLAYVTNQGGRLATASDYSNLSAGTPIVADPATGRPTTGTVSVVDLDAGRVLASIPVGLEPAAMLLHKPYLFVANANSDSVSVIDINSRAVVKTISVQPFAGAPFGSSPNALVMLPDNRLVVSLATNNALAVYGWKGPSNAVSLLGLIPTAWYPSEVTIDPKRNRLVVAALKGLGAFGLESTSPPDPATNKKGKSALMFAGLISFIPVPDRKQLVEQTHQVIADNRWAENKADGSSGGSAVAAKAMPDHIGDPSLIKHVFYIIKENQTYDQILGDEPRGNGDPNLVQFGHAVTPNHHALESQFPLLDNFYVSTVASVDGHQWANSAFVVDYIERGYAGQFKRAYPFNGGDSLAYAPSGFIWENASRHGKSVRFFGEYASQFEGAKERYGKWVDWYRDSQILEGKLAGSMHVAMGDFQTKSDVPTVDANLNRYFPPFDTGIPDQYRADVFLAEFRQHVANRDLQDLTIMTLCDDHTSGLAPGFPTPRAQVADNDLALGRVIEAITNSSYWPDSAIFVIEDDAANGVDHVDGHRSPAFIISPYARRGAVDHTYYTQIDVVRTIEQILGLPPMNQKDMVATPMRTVFTDMPDLTAYKAVPNETSLEEITQAQSSNPMRRAWELTSAKMLSAWPPVPDAHENLMNRAIWYSTFNFTRPYPGDSRVLLPSKVPRGLQEGD